MGSFTMILMDTCAIIWDALEPDKLSKNALNAINKADECNALIISDISIWEISMLIKKKRIEVDATAANFINLFLQSRSISVQSISPEIAELSVNFGSDINNDPADRIIAATSIILNAQLVTADQNLIDSQMINTVW
jgi:PIN domain nuclease of toxin-antitoxin system